MARLALKLFGSYRLALDGQPIDILESEKTRALLAYLAVENDRPHSREKLVGIFWPEQNEEHARGSLSQALYILRGVLGDRPPSGVLHAESQTHEPILLISPKEIQLNPHSDFTTDVASFSTLVKACKAHGHPATKICDECLKRYLEVVSLYHGDFLEGFYLSKSLAFEEWATIQREQLRLAVMEVLEHLVTTYERLDELETALAYARQMVQLDELSEPGNQHMMRLLALMDRLGDALAHYAEFHHTLAVQMGAEPGIETKALYQRLRAEESGKELGNLPASLTPIVGRKSELDELWGLLRESRERLICVIGLGGCGKTRLVQEAAFRQRYYYRDGVFFVPLSALGPGSSLLAAIAEGLGFTFQEFADPKRQLIDYLRSKKILLVLDSFEIVVERAGLVVELLAASEGSKALVTSRVRLNVSGEHLYPLEGMCIPPLDAAEKCMDYSAAELFVDAARRVKPGYMPETLESVARICRLVEGMPLSLLLASTWVSDHSTQEIVAQINRSLDFLTVELADLPERQRSLRATFEYSWNLLRPREQELLMSLSVFRNPFTIQAAQQVAGASVQMLHSLVGKSLLGVASEGQYQMHDLVRQYSGEKLALAPDGRERTGRQLHSDYFLQQVADWCAAFKGALQSVTLNAAEKVIDDVQVAWSWAVRQMDVKKLSRSVEGLCLFHNLRYRFLEGEHVCQLTLDALEEIPAGSEQQNLEGCVLAWLTSFYRLLGKVELARKYAEKSSQALEQAEAVGQDARPGLALLWRERGYLAGSLLEQLDCHRRSAEIFGTLNDPWWQAVELSWAAELVNRLGDRESSVTLHQRALSLSRVAGEPRRLASVLMLFAYYHLIFGPWETGLKLMEESAKWYKSVGDLGSQANAELQYGTSLGWTGHYAEACERLKIAIEKLHQLGDRFYIAYGTLALAIGQMHSGWYDQAEVTMQRSLDVARQNGFQREEAYGLAQAACLELVQEKTNQALVNLQMSVVSFRQMGFAGELGTALGALALAYHKDGQEENAWSSLQEAVRIAIETHSRFTLFTLAAALVVLLVDAERWEQSVEAYVAAMTDPIVANSRWFADMVGNRVELAKMQLPEELYLAAEARGREGDVFVVLGRLANEIDSWGPLPGSDT